jgi:hypothetical protein
MIFLISLKLFLERIKELLFVKKINQLSLLFAKALDKNPNGI